MKNIRKALRLIPKARRYLFAITVFALLSSAMAALRPLLYKAVVDQVASTTQLPSLQAALPKLIAFLAILAVIGILVGIFSGYEWRYTEKIFYLLESILRTKVFDKLNNLSISYFEKEKSGALQNKLLSGINNLVGFTSNFSYNFIGGVCTLIVILIIVGVQLPLISIIMALLVFFQSYSFVRTAKKTKPIQEKSRKNEEEADAIFFETFSHISTVRTMGIENERKFGLLKAIEKAKKYQNKNVDTWFRQITSREIVFNLMIALCIGITVAGVFTHHNSIGDVVLVALYLQQLNGVALGIGRFITFTARQEVGVGRLMKVLETKPDIVDSKDAVDIKALESVEFKNVSFTYPGSKKGAVYNISFTLIKGKTLALVGPSGVGKSTITKLLLRFYEPTSGQILINNKDISAFTQDSLRKHMGMVMQDVALFNATINENLAIANPKANEAIIQKAARQAHAEEFIAELPKGYKTLVGERGVKLSGGQKQRIAITRTILKDPNLIILDEATSALDSESEQLVQDGLHKLMQSRSAVIIAHRLSTVMHADEIVVLEKGHIVERGDHKHLMDSKGLYAKLFSMQSATGKVEL